MVFIGRELNPGSLSPEVYISSRRHCAKRKEGIRPRYKLRECTPDEGVLFHNDGSYFVVFVILVSSVCVLSSN